MPMSKKYKDNVIPFPNLKEKQIQEKLKQSKEAVDFIANESIDTASYMMDVMESELQHMTESLFSRVKFRDPDTPESKDMFVILNLINAMFHRYAGLPHHLQLELEDIYKILKDLEDNGPKKPDNYLDILFDPEFGFPIDPDEGGLGDDDDNS